MSRFRTWGVAAALACAAGTAAPVSAADAPDTDTRPWYKKMFGGSPPKPAGPTVRSGPVVPRSAPLPPEMVQAAFQAEKDALMRRLDVCDALRLAAVDRNDNALYRQADELERQARATYDMRVAALGVSKNLKAPLPTPTSGAAAASFDLAPEKAPDAKTAAARLIAPAAPVPVSGTASAAPEPTVREVKP